MERWLSMELAGRLGVWANPDFPFPRHLIKRAIVGVLGEEQLKSRGSFEPEILTWSVADLLHQHLEHPQFGSIRTYLADDERGIRRIQLAERIARTFDQYVVYRPEMILGWERGNEAHWQAVLWRALVKRHGGYHIAAHTREFLEVLQRPDVDLGSIPVRISVFGVSTLPPLYLQVLAALSQHIELHLFLLSPSPEYWGEIRSQREMLRMQLKRGAPVVDIDDALHLGDTNPLLASLGRLGRDFQQVLEGRVDYHEDDRDLYEAPATGTMLATLQSDIMSLRERAPDNRDAPPLSLDPDDDSIAVHACHGPMREVEVLHDQLLALFERDRALQPHEVVVMSPAIDGYAPYIDAVFRSGSEGQSRIPYRITDRAVRATDDVVDAFLSLIAVLRGRMTASELLDLLALDSIRERFEFGAEDLDLIRMWIKESGIRWGIDATHRQEEGQPPLTENTWRFGLDRLLLGYAAPGAGRCLYEGVLPYDDIEGTSTELLGRLVDFCEQLFTFHRALQAPRPLDAWRDDLGSLLRTMVVTTDKTAHQHRQIHAALAELSEQAEAGEFRDAVDLDTVQMQVATALERSAPGRGFLTGGVTFCALVPMRSIPFRVVCLVGMNDTDFPRTRRPLGFDLIAQKPLPGDRSSRDDDRYLFLEALLSARERFIVTYVGQSIRDNGEIPPSVVVSELLDTLGDTFRVDATGPSQSREEAHDVIRERLVLRHPLQPFSPRYFGADPDPRLFSYGQNTRDGARALGGARAAAPPFVPSPLPSDTDDRQVSVEKLVAFFQNPTRVFLQDRLALCLGTDVEVVDDREPLALDNLERWKVGNQLLDRAIAGEDISAALASVQASGALPPGVLGECFFQDLHPEVSELAEKVDALLHGNELDALTVDHKLGDTHLTGVIRNLWPAGQARYQFSRVGGRHELGVWIRHVILNWLRPKAYPLTSIMVGRVPKGSGAATVRFRPVKNAAGILRELVRLYWLGQRIALPLFEMASRTYADKLSISGDEKALEAARESFAGYRYGDRDNPYVAQVFSTVDPFDARTDNLADWGNIEPPSFVEVACTVFDPLLAHREEVR